MPKYTSIFIVPVNTKKTLSDDGWIFNSDITLSPNIIDVLVDRLNLIKSEEYIGIISFNADDIQVNVITNNNTDIEYIHIKYYAGNIDSIKSILNINEIVSCAELFIPQQKT